MRGQGRSRLSLQDRMVRLQGAWDAHAGLPGTSGGYHQRPEGERPSRPSSEPEDIRGEGTRQEAEDQAGTHCHHSGGRRPGCEQRSRSSKVSRKRSSPEGQAEGTNRRDVGAGDHRGHVPGQMHSALRPSAVDHCELQALGARAV